MQAGGDPYRRAVPQIISPNVADLKKTGYAAAVVPAPPTFPTPPNLHPATAPPAHPAAHPLSPALPAVQLPARHGLPVSPAAGAGGGGVVAFAPPPHHPGVVLQLPQAPLPGMPNNAQLLEVIRGLQAEMSALKQQAAPPLPAARHWGAELAEAQAAAAAAAAADPPRPTHIHAVAGHSHYVQASQPPTSPISSPKAALRTPRGAHQEIPLSFAAESTVASPRAAIAASPSPQRSHAVSDPQSELSQGGCSLRALTLRSQIVRLQSEVNELTRINERKAADLQSMSDEMRELESAALQAGEVGQRVKGLQQELNRAVDEVHYLRVENQCLGSEATSAKEDVERISAQRDGLLSDLELAQERLSAAALEVEGLHGNAATLHEQLDAATATGSHNASEKLRAASQLHAIAIRLDAVFPSDTAGAGVSDAAGGADPGVTILERIDALMDRLARAEGDSATASRMVDTLRQDLAEGNETVSRLQKDLGEVSEAASAAASANAAGQGELARMAAAGAEKEKTVAHFEREVTALRAYNKSLEVAHHDLQQRLGEAEEANRVLEAAAGQAASSARDAEQNSHQAILSNNQLELDLTEARQKLLSAEHRVGELQADVTNLLEEHKAEKEAREKAESQMANNLQERNAQVVELSGMLSSKEAEAKRQRGREDELKGRVEAAQIEKKSLMRDFERISLEVSGLKTERDTAIGEARELLSSVSVCEETISRLREEGGELRSQLQSRQGSGGGSSFEPVRAVLEERLASWARDNKTLHAQLQAVSEERDSLLTALKAAQRSNRLISPTHPQERWGEVVM